MGVHRNDTATPDAPVLVSWLQGEARRHARWEQPRGQQRQIALLDLRELLDLRDDGDKLAAEAAGIMLGCHPPGDSHHEHHRIAAGLLLEAADLTVEHPAVRHWIAVGEERRRGAIARHRAGDPNARR